MTRNHECRPRTGTGDRFDANAPPRRAGNGHVEPRDEYASHDATSHNRRARPRADSVVPKSGPQNSLMRESEPPTSQNGGRPDGQISGFPVETNTPRIRGRVGHNWTLFPPVRDSFSSPANNPQHRIGLEDRNPRSQNTNLPFDQSHLPPPDNNSSRSHRNRGRVGHNWTFFPSHNEEADHHESSDSGSSDAGPPDRRFDEGYDSDSFDALYPMQRGSIHTSPRLTSHPSEQPRLRRARPLRDYGIESGNVSPTIQRSRQDIESCREAYLEEYRARPR